MRYIWLFLFSIMLTSCENLPEEAEHVRQARRVLREYSEYLKKEKNIPYGSKGGHFFGGIQSFRLDLSIYGEPSVEEARKLSICVLKGLIERVNSDEGLRLHLPHYPFAAEDFDFSFGFKIHREDGADWSPPYGKVAQVVVVRGNVSYSTFNPDSMEKIKHEVLHEETYEEALEIVQKSEDCESVRN